jgi:hypothetical protein
MDDLMERHVRVKMDGLTLWAYQRSFTVLKRFYYANKSKVRGKLDSMREKMKAKKARSFTSSPLRLPLPTHTHMHGPRPKPAGTGFRRFSKKERDGLGFFRIYTHSPIDHARSTCTVTQVPEEWDGLGAAPERHRGAHRTRGG